MNCFLLLNFSQLAIYAIKMRLGKTMSRTPAVSFPYLFRLRPLTGLLTEIVNTK